VSCKRLIGNRAEYVVRVTHEAACDEDRERREEARVVQAEVNESLRGAGRASRYRGDETARRWHDDGGACRPVELSSFDQLPIPTPHGVSASWRLGVLASWRLGVLACPFI
jgi:hypothetical protein